jgi:hypothetical protein
MRKAQLSCGDTQLSDSPAFTNTSPKRRKYNSSTSAPSSPPQAAPAHSDLFVQCYLNVTSAMHAKDGFVCVAIQTSCTRSRNAMKKVQNIYVSPQHLRLVRDNNEEAQAEWTRALKYIIL